MTVAELIAQLQAMPQDVEVQINDNSGGNVFELEQVDHFDANDEWEDPEVVMLQVNC